MTDDEKDRAVSRIVRAVGKDVRQHIRRLPPDVRDLGWAAIVAGLLGAALHDCDDPTKILGMMSAVVETLPVLRAHRDG